MNSSSYLQIWVCGLSVNHKRHSNMWLVTLWFLNRWLLFLTFNYWLRDPFVIYAVHTHSYTHSHLEAAQYNHSLICWPLSGSAVAVEGLNAQSHWNFAGKSIHFSGIATIRGPPRGGEVNLWIFQIKFNSDTRDQQQTVLTCWRLEERRAAECKTDFISFNSIKCSTAETWFTRS